MSNTDCFFAPESFEVPASGKTPGFILRSCRSGDGPARLEATRGSYEHLRPWMPWAKEVETEEESERLVRMFRARWLLSEDFAIAICDLDDRRFLGTCGYHLREGPLSVKIAEMGMWIRVEEAGKGLGTAALRALLEWGFTEWPWERLSWRCDVENVASVRVAEKVGMVREGTLRQQATLVGEARRDTACFAMLKSEWKR